MRKMNPIAILVLFDLRVFRSGTPLRAERKYSGPRIHSFEVTNGSLSFGGLSARILHLYDGVLRFEVRFSQNPCYLISAEILSRDQTYLEEFLKANGLSSC